MARLAHLAADIRRNLSAQLRELWTHTSTALEGNTLSLGETHFVLREGLTVQGKPLKDHNEVIGHARAMAGIFGFPFVDTQMIVTAPLLGWVKRNAPNIGYEPPPSVADAPHP